MGEERFDLVFRGELVEGVDPDTVRARLAALLQLDEQRADRLLAGRPVTVKRGADRTTAARLQQAFRKAGGRLRAVPANDPGPPEKAAARVPLSERLHAADGPAPDSASPDDPPAGDGRADGGGASLSERLGTAAAAAGAREPVEPGAADPGARPAKETGSAAPERPDGNEESPSPRRTDAPAERAESEVAPSAGAGSALAGSALAAQPLDGDPFADAVPDDAAGARAFELGAADADLLTAAERQRPRPVSVSVDHLELAEPGDLGAPAPPPPGPVPDTDHLSIEDEP